MLRWIGRGLLALLLLVVAGLVATWLLLDRYDLALPAATRASARLGRPVSIGSLHITPGRWLRLELRQAKVDNIAGGTRPAMVEVASVVAEVEATSLVWGPPVVRSLVVDGLQVFLEHVADGTANWRVGAPGRPASAAPRDRAGFPTLLDLRVAGDVVIRTSAGHEQRVHLDAFAIQTEAADRPVRLTANGTYNDVPLGLAADLAPITALRDAATPYPAELRFTSGETALTFKGTMTDPLAVDGARGTLSLAAPTPEAIYRMIGVDSTITPPVRLGGGLLHDGPVWDLTEATGAIGPAVFSNGSLKLVDGGRGAPDSVTVDLAFDQLDLNALVGRSGRGGGQADMTFGIGRTPDPLVDAKLSARGLSYAGVRADDVTFAATVRPGVLKIDVLTLGYIGANVKASGEIKDSEGGGTVTANLSVAGLDVQGLRKLLGIGTVPLQGRVSGEVSVVGTGATLNQATRGARISAVAVMEGGSVSRQIVQLASTDVRALFSGSGGQVPVSCAAAVIDIRAGAGTVSPLRIRSEPGTIAARGRFDLYRGTVDLTVSSETRSLLALDVPVQISGSLTSPVVRPAILSAAGRAQLAAGDDLGRLLPEVQAVARRSRCVGAR